MPPRSFGRAASIQETRVWDRGRGVSFIPKALQKSKKQKRRKKS